MHEPSVVLATKLLAVSQAHVVPEAGLIHPVFLVQSASVDGFVFVHVVSAGAGGVALSSTQVVSHLHPAPNLQTSSVLSAEHLRSIPVFVHAVPEVAG